MVLGGKPLHPFACQYGTDARLQSHPAFPHTLHRKQSSVSGDCTFLGTTFGEVSAVIGPCIDSFSCSIVSALPASHWHWDALLGP